MKVLLVGGSGLIGQALACRLLAGGHQVWVLTRSTQGKSQPGCEHGRVTWVTWDGKTTRVRYSVLDMGQIQDGFDGNDQSILRTLEANPMQLDIQTPEPRTFQHLGVRVGGTGSRVTIYLYEEGLERPRIYSQQVWESPEPRYVTFNFDRAVTTKRIWISVLSVYDREPAHVHLWEVKVW